jgi:hypothetical protein
MIVALSSFSLTACNHNLFKTDLSAATTTTPTKTQPTPSKPSKTVIKAKPVSAPKPVISTATTTDSNPSPERSLKEIANEALASKGKLTKEQINAILKTQSVCRAIDYK